MIIEFAKEVANKRASSNNLHPPFQGAEHQKLHHFYCPAGPRARQKQVTAKSYVTQASHEKPISP